MVITIIILIILATITINFAFGENGLITRAQWAQEQYEIEQVREKLEMAKGSAFADGKGKIDPDHYFDILEQEEIIGSKENDVKDNGDGTYDVTTNEGYIFEITLVPSAENPEDLEIEYVGKGDVTGPRITSFTSTGSTTNSISVAVEGRNLEGAEYTYSFKKSSEEGEDAWIEFETSENSTCTISGLETGVVYDIKVVVTTSEGTAEKQLSERTGELKEGSITIGNIVWQGDGTAKVTVTTDITEPGCYIEYKIGADGDTWTRIASGDEITLQLNDEVYVRVTDGTNVLKDAYRKIEDATNPIISKVETSNVTSNSITVTVTAEDNESGLATNGTYKYYLNNGEAITSTENSYTFEGLEAETMYTIKVEAFDKAGNKGEDSVTVSTIEDKSEVEQAKESGKEFQEKTPIKDEHDNIIVVPEGFKIASDSGDTVQQGIVIEDVSASGDANVQGSQFVWIPVGTFTKDDGTTSNEIVLGRYTFDENNGTPHLEQAAYTSSNPTNYLNEIKISNCYMELSTYREGTRPVQDLNDLNATAKNLAAFVDSVKTNGGYYVGRYEASYASGDINETWEDLDDNAKACKASSKISTASSYAPVAIKEGMLWNATFQNEASKIAINTYIDSLGVQSDLMNSYSWDTAIVYIQEAGNNNYANKRSINSNITNTGTIGDEVCKINDMASNLYEWTTEYSTYIIQIDINGHISEAATPYSIRGGCYSTDENYTSYRDSYGYFAPYSRGYVGFRLCLFINEW